MVAITDYVLMATEGESKNVTKALMCAECEKWKESIKNEVEKMKLQIFFREELGRNTSYQKS